MRTYEVTEDLAERVKKDFPKEELMIDKELLFNTEFAPKLMVSKFASVKYRKGKVRVPASKQIPLFEANQSTTGQLLGTVYIDRVVIKTFAEITDQDGKNDGFANKKELIDVLTKFNGVIPNDAPISIYHFSRFKKTH